MIASKITTHVTDALNRLLQQYKDRPRITGWYTTLVEQVQELEDAIFSVDEGRMIWNGTTTPAFGQQLDGIGDIVGIKRNGLPDNEYILFIFGKIAENFSDTTIPTILTVISYVFQTSQVFVAEAYPAGLEFEVFSTPLPSRLWPLAQSIVEQALGAGIRLYFAAARPDNRAFRFDGPGVVGALNGFGDKNDASVGGVFVGRII